MKALVNTREAADLTGYSERHVRRVTASRIADRPGARRREYSVAALAPDAQAAWGRRDNVVPFFPGQSTPGQLALSLTIPVGPNLAAEDREEVERRYQVLEPLLRPNEFTSIWAECRNSKVAVVQWLAKHHKTKQRTIYNWLTAWRQGGLPALVPKDRKDKGIPRILNPAALDFLVAAAFPKHGAYGKLTVRDIYRAYREERTWRAANAGKLLGDFDARKYSRYLGTDGTLATTALLPEASYSTFRNWFERIPEIAKIMAREGDEAFHNTQEIISFRNLTDVQPLDYLVMDHRRLDFFCLIQGRGEWKLARPWLTAAIDMRTRKWLAWAIVETPSSDSIASVLKRSFLEHGLPQACCWDNGKDFRCEWLEGGNSRVESRRIDQLETGFRGVLDTLGIRVHHAIVKRARSKIIEPNFGRTADFDRTLPWWCGHNPGARPTERFDKLLHQHERWIAGEPVEPAFPTIEQVAALYDDCMAELNERPLEGEGMNKITATGRGWLCPNESWERLIGRVPKREVPEDVIHLCFAKRRTLHIRNGEIQTTFGGKVWHYRIASNPARLMAFNGCEIEFAYDPLDLQTGCAYYQGRLLGLVNCIELRRMGEDSFVEDEKLRRVARRETKAFIAQVHKAVHVPDAMERSARRTVQPRMEPARMVIQAALPEALVEAAAAQASEVAPPARIEMDRIVPADAVADEEFNFFGREGTL